MNTGGAIGGTICATPRPPSYTYTGGWKKLDVTIEIDYEMRIR
jgi:hypothetical protein